MRFEYKPIGDLVQVVNQKNNDLSVTQLIGLSIDKCYIPSVANVIGTDLSTYKIIKRKQFACSLMQVSRDEKIPIACMMDYEEAIMSPAYVIFEIIDESILLPEYLNMWVMRAEFDREASFLAVGGVRGSLAWEDFCRMKLPVPSIDEQRKIAATYKTITDRIELKKRINDNLEDQLHCIFIKAFGKEMKLKDALPLGWQRVEAQDVYDITIGKTPPRERLECFTENATDIKWVSISDMGSNGAFILDTAEKLTPAAVKEFNVKTIPAGTVIYSFKMTNGRTALTTEECATNEAIAHFRSSDEALSMYAFCYLSAFRFSDLGSTSSITEAVNSKIIKTMPFILPPRSELKQFHSLVVPIFNQIKQNALELRTLKNLSSTFLSILSC